MPAASTASASSGAKRKNRDAARVIQAPARPPSTASGGSTNTKCRMPLYMAGRSATVTASGSKAASPTTNRTARRFAATSRRDAAIKAPAAPPKPSTRKISGSLSASSTGT